MLLDDLFYEKAVSEFESNFSDIFSDEIIAVNKDCDYTKNGYFKLSYKYIPLNYNILVENERRTFTITIEDNENAKNSLYRIRKFDNVLDKDNIRNAIHILKEILEKNEFNFYLYIDKKLYRKSNKGLERVKDLRELLNG